MGGGEEEKGGGLVVSHLIETASFLPTWMAERCK